MTETSKVDEFSTTVGCGGGGGGGGGGGVSMQGKHKI